MLRVVAYIQQSNEIQRDPSTAFLRREQWIAFDPQLIAEGLFAAANIFRFVNILLLMIFFNKFIIYLFQRVKTGSFVFN